MRIALLCPGPSLPEFWESWSEAHWDNPPNLVVAVNTAGWLFSCDWLCCADMPIITDLHDFSPNIKKTYLEPRIGYITHPLMDLPAGEKRELLPLRYIVGEGSNTCKYPLPPEKPTDACAFTFPNALQWCQNRLNAAGVGQHTLDLFGFDCSPSPLDCAGREGQHHLERWRWEMPWIKHAWFPGIKVHSRLPIEVHAWLDDRGSWADAEAALTGFHAGAPLIR